MQIYRNIVTEPTESELKDRKICGNSYYTANVHNVLQNYGTQLQNERKQNKNTELPTTHETLFYRINGNIVNTRKNVHQHLLHGTSVNSRNYILRNSFIELQNSVIQFRKVQFDI